MQKHFYIYFKNKSYSFFVALVSFRMVKCPHLPCVGVSLPHSFRSFKFAASMLIRVFNKSLEYSTAFVAIVQKMAFNGHFWTVWQSLLLSKLSHFSWYELLIVVIVVDLRKFYRFGYRFSSKLWNIVIFTRYDFQFMSKSQYLWHKKNSTAICYPNHIINK